MLDGEFITDVIGTITDFADRHLERLADQVWLRFAAVHSLSNNASVARNAIDGPSRLARAR
jgi:hypothetical protein